MKRIVRTTSENEDFKKLVVLLDQELAIRDGVEHDFYHQFNTIVNLNHVVVAYSDNLPVACGAFKDFDSETVEIKRMFVMDDFRKKGFATAVVAELEKWIIEKGIENTVLETGKNQPEAIALYQKNGYKMIPNYGQYIGVENSVCFTKKLI